MPLETLSDDEIDCMVGLIVPEWEICAKTPLELGGHPVYRLEVKTPTGKIECYLKATGEGQSPSVAFEARLLSVINAHTTIPVPTVYGVVDEHANLPAPFVLLSAMPGESRFRTALKSYPEDRLQRIAHDSGSYLADLHSLDVVDSFGFLTYEGPVLHGDRPLGNPASIVVSDPIESWHDQILNWTDVAIDAVEQTQFADIASKVELVIASRIGALEGPFRPVLARIDHSLDNLLVHDGELTALLDWEFTMAATPAYDLAYVAFSLDGGQYRYAPGMPDRRQLVREALLTGYKEHSDDPSIDQIRQNWVCYELLTMIRAMIHLEDWYQGFDLQDEIDPAAEVLRAELSTIIKSTDV